MVFSQTGREINNLSQVFKNFGSNYALFNKSFANIGKDLKNGLGIRSFTNIVSKTDIENFNKFNNALNSGIGYSQAFTDHLSKSSTTIQRQAVEVQKLRIQQNILNTQRQTGKITEEQYSAAMTANKAKMQALTTQTQSLTLSQKAATAASKGLSIAMNLLGNIAIMGIITLISKGVKYLSDLANHVEITKEKVDELTSTFKSALDEANSNAKRVEELADRYDELSDGVNNLGENVALTNEEYEEYNSLVNEIADMFPNLIQGYTDEGNAILNLKGNVEGLRDAYKEAQQEAYNLLIAGGKDSDGNDILQRWKDLHDTGFWAKMFDFGAPDVNGQLSVNGAITLLNALQNIPFDKFQEISKLVNNMEEDQSISDFDFNGYEDTVARNLDYYKKALGLTGQITEDDYYAIRKQAQTLIQTYNAEIELGLSNVKTLANAYLMTNNDYKQLDTQAQNAVSIIVNSLDEGIASGFEDKIDVGQYVSNIVESISTNDEAQQALNNLFTMDMENIPVDKIQSDINKYIDIIAQVIGEDSDKLKIRLGFDDIDNKLQRAKAKFVEGKFNAKPISDFLEKLTPKELDIAMQIPDLFDEGLEGATKKIEAWGKQNPIETEVKITIDEALEGQTNKIKAITSAMEDMSETGYITSETYAELAKLGGNFTDCLEWENGKLKLNVDKLKDLEIQQLATAKSANSLAISELELKAASLAAHGQDFSDIQAQIESLMKENAVYTQLMEEIANAKPDDKSSSEKSEEPESVTQFKKALAEKEHLLNTNQISEQDYYEWLDDESKRVYGNLADYEEDLWKYEEQVYKWRQEQEQDLFDKKIENLEKEKDKALENNDFDTAKKSVNSAIAETQNRINELSLKTGFEDEIEELTSDLEGLYDTLDDINKKEIESQKDYIETLKNEYSDLMDEQIDQQKKLADSINKAYENQIKTIDKQIDAINKVSEAEERQKKILDAEKDVKEAMQELDKASIKNRLVYSGDGTWQLKEDKTAVKEAKKNLAEKQEALDKAKEDEKIAKLEEQKELLETQKNNSKDYYDKVVADLEEQKAEREKQYDILVDIYEQLGGEKRQTSLNESLVEKLTSNGDINKAVQGLTPTEMKQAITSGILTTDSNGNYAIDYSILNKNEQAVKDNTDELAKLNNQLSGKNDTADKNNLTYNNKNLDAEGYLIGANGKRVLNDGKPIHAKNFSAEIEKRKNNEKIGNAVGDIGKFAGYDTMKELLNAMMTGNFTVPTATANSMMNSNINSSIGRDITKVPEYINNNITNNNTPSFTINNNVQGDMSEKTADYVNNQLKQTLVEYTKYFGQEYCQEMMRRQSKL